MIRQPAPSGRSRRVWGWCANQTTTRRLSPFVGWERSSAFVPGWVKTQIIQNSPTAPSKYSQNGIKFQNQLYTELKLPMRNRTWTCGELWHYFCRGERQSGRREEQESLVLIFRFWLSSPHHRGKEYFVTVHSEWIEIRNLFYIRLKSIVTEGRPIPKERVMNRWWNWWELRGRAF